MERGSCPKTQNCGRTRVELHGDVGEEAWRVKLLGEDRLT